MSNDAPMIKKDIPESFRDTAINSEDVSAVLHGMFCYQKYVPDVRKYAQAIEKDARYAVRRQDVFQKYVSDMIKYAAVTAEDDSALFAEASCKIIYLLIFNTFQYEGLDSRRGTLFD